MDVSLVAELRPLFAGRKVVLTGGPLAALTGMCRRLRELGAERPFLLATGMGTGEVPDPGEAEWCVVEVRAPDVVAEIRAATTALPVFGKARRAARAPMASCSASARE